MRWILVARAVTSLAAWWCFFTAATLLPIAQATTLYLAAPVIAVGLSAYVLCEPITARSFAALSLGAGGSLAALDKFGVEGLTAPLLAFAGAGLWAVSMVLMRRIGQRASSLLQLSSNNALFLLATVPLAAGNWHRPSLTQLTIMLGLGVLSGAGQWLLVASAKRAPVSLTAPLQYTGLPWAFVLGFLIWGDVPRPNVILGSVMIGAAGLLVILSREPTAASPALVVPQGVV